MATTAQVSARMASVEGVAEAPSQFGHPVAFWYGGKEVAHLEGETDGVVEVEIRLGRKHISARRQAFNADERVELRPSTSDWMTIGCRIEPDIADAVELLRVAVGAT